MVLLRRLKFQRNNPPSLPVKWAYDIQTSHQKKEKNKNKKKQAASSPSSLPPLLLGPGVSFSFLAYSRSSPTPPGGLPSGSSQPGGGMNRYSREPVTLSTAGHCWLGCYVSGWIRLFCASYPWLVKQPQGRYCALKVKSRFWPPWDHSAVSSWAGLSCFVS